MSINFIFKLTDFLYVMLNKVKHLVIEQDLTNATEKTIADQILRFTQDDKSS